ncbi:MAG: TolC family protein, partial [Pirellulaceae bacterium]|nr:TolC family protein [Pirellulaceae bacterium]
VRNFERFRREFLFRLASDYFDLLRSRANVENLETQEGNFKKLHKGIKALADKGRVALFEAERVNQQVLFATNNLRNAEESYEGDLDAFKVSIGMRPQQDLSLLPTEITIPPLVLNRVESTASAHKFRLDLQTSSNQIGDAKRGAANARNGLLPDLDLAASLTLPSDPSVKWPGIQLDPHTGGYSVALAYGAPIDRRIERIRYRQSLITLERTVRSHTLLRDLITQQVRRSIRRIELARSTLDLQTENKRIATKRSTGVDLRLRTLGPRDKIEAEEDALEAKTRYEEAKRDVRVNVLRYLLDTGQMRVDPHGRWLPPAKLVPIKPEPEAPNAKAPLKGANSDLVTRQG